MGLYGGLGEKGVHMSSKTRNLIATASLLAFCGVASAYTITGSVSDDQGKALKGASGMPTSVQRKFIRTSTRNSSSRNTGSSTRERLKNGIVPQNKGQNNPVPQEIATDIRLKNYT